MPVQADWALMVMVKLAVLIWFGGPSESWTCTENCGVVPVDDGAVPESAPVEVLMESQEG